MGFKSFRPLIDTCSDKEEMLKMFHYIYPTARETLVKAIKIKSYKEIKVMLKELCEAMRAFTNGP